MTGWHSASVGTSHLDSKDCHPTTSPPLPRGGAHKKTRVCYIEGRIWRTGRLTATQIKMTEPIQKP